MLLIKALIVLLLNTGMAFLLAYSLKVILFYPNNKRYLFNKRIPFTPSLIYRLKQKLFDRVKGLLQSFLQECENRELNGKIKEFEQEVYTKVWQRVGELKLKYVPRFLKLEIQKIVAELAYEFISHFIRTFIPYLIEHYRLESYIDLVDIKLDIKILEGYYTRYIHRYFLYFLLFFFFLTGLFNMLIFLILG